MIDKNTKLSAGDTLVSNNGKGPQIAIVGRILDGWVSLKRGSGKRFAYFSLPLWFLSSPACGWVLNNKFQPKTGNRSAERAGRAG